MTIESDIIPHLVVKITPKSHYFAQKQAVESKNPIIRKGR